MVIDDTFFMELAIKEAWKFQLLTYPNPAVGCCIVDHNGSLLALRAHEKAGCAHAEVLALQDAYVKLTNDTSILSCSSSHDIHQFLLDNHNNIFSKCTLYVTLEPCAHVGKTPSCALLICHLHIRRIIIGAKDETKAAKGGIRLLQDSNITTNISSLRQEADDLLFPFNAWQKKSLVFFKLAQRLNGSIDGGIISSRQSRKLVHALRDVCDLLVIGGNTVRQDRPTLDARMVGGGAPDVLIVSRSKDFDHNIPLFNVPNRKVMIEDNFELIKNYRLVMIEGGTSMFEISKPYVDCYLSFVAPACDVGVGYGATKINFRFLHVSKYFDDILIWMKQDKG